jgi:chromosome segregation ATPase
VHSLAERMSLLQTNFTALFEDYRKLNLATVKIRQDRDRFAQQYRERSQEVDAARNETSSLRWDLDAVRVNLTKAQGDLEGLEKRNHMLEVEKKEFEQRLTTLSSNLRTAVEEAEANKLELNSLRQQVEGDASKLGEMTARHREAYEKSLLLAERCETYDVTLKGCYEQISGLQRNLEQLTQERNNLQHYSHQKDVEISQLRADVSRSLEKSLADLRAKDRDLADLRTENESYRSNAKIYDQVHGELKLDSETKSSQLRHQEEMITKLELANYKLEAKVGRVVADLESALTAKTQTDQSRAAMSARVDAMAQALRGREADVFRLENQISNMNAQLEDQGARGRSTIEALEAKLFELEKDLTAQKNETAYYYAQVEIMKKPENRTPNSPK